MKQDETKTGVLDALEKIKKAEENARSLLKETKEHTSLGIMQDAHEEAKKIKEQCMADARKKAREIRIDMIEKAKREASQIREETKTFTKNLAKSSEHFLPVAEKKATQTIEEILKRGAF